MSVKIKRAGAKTAKALAVVFFLFLIVFNVQVATSNEQSSDINLLGLSLSVFTPSAVASGSGSIVCYAKSCETIVDGVTGECITIKCIYRCHDDNTNETWDKECFLSCDGRSSSC